MENPKLVYIDSDCMNSFFFYKETNQMLKEVYDLCLHKKDGRHLIHYSDMYPSSVPAQLDIDTNYGYVIVVEKEKYRFEFAGVFMYDAEELSNTQAMKLIKEIL
jgi:hypothetical protein